MRGLRGLRVGELSDYGRLLGGLRLVLLVLLRRLLRSSPRALTRIAVRGRIRARRGMAVVMIRARARAGTGSDSGLIIDRSELLRLSRALAGLGRVWLLLLILRGGSPGGAAGTGARGGLATFGLGEAGGGKDT